MQNKKQGVVLRHGLVDADVTSSIAAGVIQDWCHTSWFCQVLFYAHLTFLVEFFKQPICQMPSSTKLLNSKAASLARPFYPNLDPQPPLTNMFLKTFQFPSMYMHVHLMLTMNICCCCHIHSHGFSQEMKFRKQQQWQWPPKMVLPFHDGNGNRYLVAGSPFPATFSTANYASWIWGK